MDNSKATEAIQKMLDVLKVEWSFKLNIDESIAIDFMDKDGFPFGEIWVEEGDYNQCEASIVRYISGGYMEADDFESMPITGTVHISAALLALATHGLDEALSQAWDRATQPSVYEENMDLYDMDYDLYAPDTCPHGNAHHECGACMSASDFYADVARENAVFGR